jgi:MtrB/PioB family decaheme-associated outer membrane protein
MKTRLLTILIAAMMIASGALFAQDKDFKLSGSAALSGIAASQSTRDAAKLFEYRDLSDGVFGVFDLHGRNDRFYIEAFGENLGRDDTYFNIQGGMYGQFSFRLYGDWLTHNFGFGPNGARTPYINPGTTNLRLFATSPVTLSNSGVPPWTSFNFKTDRYDIGGDVEYFGKSPFYFLVNVNEVNLSGINKVDAAALGTSPGNGFIDLPYTLDYKTRNVSVEGGYQSRRGHLSVNWLESDFGNKNPLLNFQNPFFGFGTDTATFAPDNDYTRIGVNGMFRQLPWNSTLSGRVTYAKSTDSVDMLDEVLNTSGSNALTLTRPSAAIFNGKVVNTTAQFSFASVPLRGLDTRVYYNYYRRHNTSTDIQFQVPLTTTGLVCFTGSTESATNVNIFCTGDRYGYSKHNPGFEAEYRIVPGYRVSGGFDYLDMKRDRFDADYTREKKVFVQISSTSLDTLTARLKYQYMQRRSDFLINSAGFNSFDPFYLERFNRSFDVTNLNQHLLKAYVDWTPIKLLNIGFEAYYKKNKYKDLTLGRTNDRRKEFYGNVSYGDPTKFSVTLFGDIEFIKYDSYHRTIGTTPCPRTSPNCFDPNSAPTTTAFNWNSRLKDKNWTVEFGADWPVIQRLVLKGSAIYQETRGGVDFQSQTLANGTPAALLFPIDAYDNTKRWSVNPRAVYQIIRQVELTLGYAFENYEYRDTQFSGYQHTIGTGTTTSYLSGIYAFPDYRAHIVYSSLRYQF